jgi:hypothetical protein
VANTSAPQLTWANIIATMLLMLTLFGGAWVLFQAQFASLKEQFTSADKSQQKQIDSLSDLVRYNSTNTVLRSEHIEFVKRLDRELGTIAEQLKIIETTRPTTGELQSIGISVKEQLSEIKERVRSLEDNLRRPQALAPVTPPAPAPTTVH